MSAHESLHAYYLHQCRNVEHYLELCKVYPEAELVHQLRLSIKKLRAFHKLALHLFASDTIEYVQIKHRIKQLYKLAGQLRDTQVQMQLLATFEEQTGIDYPEFNKWLLRREKKRIARFEKKSKHAHSQTTEHITHQKIEDLLARANDEKLQNCMSMVIADMFTANQKLASGSMDEQDLHRIRIITKQIRYILNMVQPAGADFIFNDIPVDLLREIETVTGHWHDCLVKVELLNRCLEKLQLTDTLDVLKYQKLMSTSNSELHIAYQDACCSVRRIMLKKDNQE